MSINDQRNCQKCCEGILPLLSKHAKPWHSLMRFPNSWIGLTLMSVRTNVRWCSVLRYSHRLATFRPARPFYTEYFFTKCDKDNMPCKYPQTYSTTPWTGQPFFCIHTYAPIEGESLPVAWGLEQTK